MDQPSDIYVRKQWFIKSNKGRLEDYYEFDSKKVNIQVLINIFLNITQQNSIKSQ